MNASRVYKRCSGCGRTWSSQQDFLEDPRIRVNGYMPSIRNLADGLFLFTHQVKGCCSTISLFAGDFFHFSSGSRGDRMLFGEANCPGFCKQQHRLEPCGVRCEGAFVRDILHMLRRRQSRRQIQAVMGSARSARQAGTAGQRATR